MNTCRLDAVNGLSDCDGRLNLLIVDACRDNPFRNEGRSLGVSRGLATTGSSGVMVLYSAGTNQQALDRVPGDGANGHGLFTRVLLEQMQLPGRSVRDLIERVRAEAAKVAHAAGHEQVPAIYDESVGDFTFTPGKIPVTISTSGANDEPIGRCPRASRPTAPIERPRGAVLAVDHEQHQPRRLRGVSRSLSQRSLRFPRPTRIAMLAPPPAPSAPARQVRRQYHMRARRMQGRPTAGMGPVAWRRGGCCSC